MIFHLKYKSFLLRKYIWKCCLQMAVILSRPQCFKPIPEIHEDFGARSMYLRQKYGIAVFCGIQLLIHSETSASGVKVMMHTLVLLWLYKLPACTVQFGGYIVRFYWTLLNSFYWATGNHWPSNGYHKTSEIILQWPLLLKWIIFNTSMDKQSHAW